MKASKAQIKIIKQQIQMLSLLTMIAGAAGLEIDDVKSAMGKGDAIAPIKKPKRTAQEVEADEARKQDSQKKDVVKPDSRNMSTPLDGDDELPEITNKPKASVLSEQDEEDFSAEQLLVNEEQQTDLDSWDETTKEYSSE